MTSEKDNTYFDYLIALLNYKELFAFPENEELKGYVSEFIELLEGALMCTLIRTGSFMMRLCLRL